MRQMMKIFCAAVLTAGLLVGTAFAGMLDPTAAPAPTMKTLDQIPPTWSQKLQCDTTACPRFELVLDYFGVLDKETGLVWLRLTTGEMNWIAANRYCEQNIMYADRRWRAPTIGELLSLINSSNRIPLGNPFQNLQTTNYWTSSTSPGAEGFAWTVNLMGAGQVVLSPTTEYHPLLCVRGAQ